jgi:hypothetical protein
MMAPQNFSLPDKRIVKINNASLTHYRLGKHHPMEFFEWAIFAEDSWQKTALGSYATSEQFWVVQPLQYAYFHPNSGRQPALVIKGVEYKGLPQPYFCIVATPPFKNKAKFKKPADLLSYVPMEQIKLFSLVIPQDVDKEVSGLVKHLQQFQEFSLKSRDDIAEYLKSPVAQRWAMVDEIHKAREQEIFCKKSCVSDAAQQAALRATWSAHVDTYRVHVLKPGNQEVYDSPYPDRIIQVELPSNASNSEAANKSGGKVDKICVELAAKKSEEANKPIFSAADAEAKELQIQANYVEAKAKQAKQDAPELGTPPKEAEAEEVRDEWDIAAEKMCDEHNEKRANEKKKATKPKESVKEKNEKKRKRRDELLVEPNLQPKDSKRVSKKIVRDAADGDSPEKKAPASKKKDEKAPPDDPPPEKLKRHRRSGMKYNTKGKQSAAALEKVLAHLKSQDGTDGNNVNYDGLVATLEEAGLPTGPSKDEGQSTSSGHESALVRSLTQQLEAKNNELINLRMEFAAHKVEMAELGTRMYRQAVKDLKGIPDSPLKEK